MLRPLAYGPRTRLEQMRTSADSRRSRVPDPELAAHEVIGSVSRIAESDAGLRKVGESGWLLSRIGA
jgi:hypothetical protein